MVLLDYVEDKSKKLLTKIKTIKSVASVQVLLSKKSPVFLTPPTTWLEPPPNEEDNPPPLGF